jgi:hypothetical protein
MRAVLQHYNSNPTVQQYKAVPQHRYHQALQTVPYKYLRAKARQEKVKLQAQRKM